jgi:hypothetical protein
LTNPADMVTLTYLSMAATATNINLYKEITMLEVTQKANEVIKEFLQGKDLQSIRIMMTAG